MQITVFAKRRQASDGRIFHNYLATITDRNGSEYLCSVKFRALAPEPARCPMNICFPKSTASLSKKRYTTAQGEVGEGWTLWVSEWSEGEPYVDHSMDLFDD